MVSRHAGRYYRFRMRYIAHQCILNECQICNVKGFGGASPVILFTALVN